nr:MAG: ORF1 [TTV-like mini virus]
MPAFYRTRWRRWPTWRRRRRPYWRRRPRQTIRGRFRRRRWVRRRFLKPKYKRKLKKTKVNQWQPDSIRKCRIKGMLCMLACGQQRTNHNYILTCESYTPVSEPGGGAFSILQLSLRVFWDEYTHYRNWWTQSNQGLPLAKYSGTKIRFYKSEDTDYIVTPQTCGPFEVTLESYLNTQPSRHLMNRKSFIVPRRDRHPNRKPYITKFLKPPTLMKSQWYFQPDILNTPLLMLTISATSLTEFYAPNDQISTNMSFISLNTNLFQNPQWETTPQQPYRTNFSGTIETYLYTYGNGHTEHQNYNGLIPLFETKLYKEGKPLTKEADLNDRTYWGNPFHHRYNHKDVKIFYGKKPSATEYNQKPAITEITELFEQIRYNPFRDNGQGNKVYLKPTDTYQGSFTTLPTNTKILVENFPLWLIFWGWPDWLKKSKPVGHIHEEWQIVIQSPYLDPKRNCYVPIDRYFNTPPEHDLSLTETDRAHWHPKGEYQEYTIEKIAQTGPGAPKIHKTKLIQTQCFYKSYFKWGGCPAPMEIITNPADQEKYPVPGNILQGLEIQDPETPAEYYIYKFDERDTLLTKRAAERLRKNFELGTYFADSGGKDPTPKTQETHDSEEETPPKKKAKEDQNQQLEQLKQYQRDLKRRINKLLKTPRYYPQQ